MPINKIKFLKDIEAPKIVTGDLVASSLVLENKISADDIEGLDKYLGGGGDGEGGSVVLPDNIITTDDIKLVSEATENGVTTKVYQVGDTQFTTITNADGSFILTDVGLGENTEDGSKSYFKIDTNGLMTAKNALVYGTVYANDGKFTGDIVAKSLTLGNNIKIPAAKIDGIDNYVTFDDLSDLDSGEGSSEVTMATLAAYLKTSELSAKLGNLNVAYRGDVQTTQETIDEESGLVKTTSTYVGSDGQTYTIVTYTTKNGDYVLLNRDNTWGGGDSLVKISKEGLLEANNAIIKGTVYATDGEFTGTVKGATIQGGTLEIKSTDGNTSAKIDSNGKLTATNADITGKITATSLTLGNGVKISTSDIDGIDQYAKLGDINGVPDNVLTAESVEIINESTENGVTTKTIKVGDTTFTSTTSADGNFIITDVGLGQDTTDGSKSYTKISTDGLLTAKNAVVYGTVYANSGKFTGDIEANSLTLGNDVKISTSKIDGINNYATTSSLNNYAKKADLPKSVSDLGFDDSNIVYKGDITQTQKTDTNGVSYVETTVPTSNGNITYSTYDADDYMVFGRSKGTDSDGEDYICVSKEGLLTARNAVVYGTIYATDGKFTGDIEAKSLKLGSGVKISTNDITGLDKYATKEDVDGATVIIPNNVITTDKVSISETTDANGTTIQSISVGDKTYTSIVDGDFIYTDIGLGEDSTDGSKKYFKVDKEGLMTAKNAIVYGTIYATDGKFTGDIEAKSLKLGNNAVVSGLSADNVDFEGSQFNSVMTSTINTAKSDAIEAANQNTADKLADYSTTKQTQSLIDQKASEITLSVSQTYSTKAEVTDTIEAELENYPTTEEMNSAISLGVNGIDLSVYSTKTYTDTAKAEAIASSNSTTAEELKKYSTTEQMNSAISLGIGQIDLTVYATKESLDGYATTDALNTAKTELNSGLSAKIDGTTLSTTLTEYAKTSALDAYATKSEMGTAIDSKVDALNLSAYAKTTDVDNQIKTVEGKLALEIKTDDTGNKYAYLNASADNIKFDATKTIEIDAGNFKLTKNGKITATDGEFRGKVTATSLTLESGAKISTDNVDGINKYATTDSLDNYATKTQLDDYATKNSLNNYATKTQLETQLKGFITSGDLDAYLKTDDLNAKLGNLNVAYNGDITTTQTTDPDTGITTTTSTYKDAEGTTHTSTTFTTAASDYVLLSRNNQWGTGDTLVKISKNGLLEAKNANIAGKIYASEGEFSGKITATEGEIAGFTLDDTKLYTDRKDSLTATDESGVYIGTDGICVGAEIDSSITLDASTGKLIANNAEISGKITATEGEIANFVISDNAIRNEYDMANNSAGADKIYMSSYDRLNLSDATSLFDSYFVDADNSKDYVYVGTDGIGTYRINERTGGKITDYSQSYMSSGKLVSNNAEISGKITATEGQIANFVISDNALYNKHTRTVDGNTYDYYMNSLNTISESYGMTDAESEFVYVGTDGVSTMKFTSLDGEYNDNYSYSYSYMSAGKLYSNNAEISGKITATEGEIAGFKIEDTKLYTGTKDSIDITTLPGVYIGTDGISVGHNLVASDKTGENGIPLYYNPGVTIEASTGKLIANNADISGKITANEGTIANVAISSNYGIANDVTLGEATWGVGSQDNFVGYSGISVSISDSTISGTASGSSKIAIFSGNNESGTGTIYTSAIENTNRYAFYVTDSGLVRAKDILCKDILCDGGSIVSKNGAIGLVSESFSNYLNAGQLSIRTISNYTTSNGNKINVSPYQIAWTNYASNDVGTIYANTIDTNRFMELKGQWRISKDSLDGVDSILCVPILTTQLGTLKNTNAVVAVSGNYSYVDVAFAIAILAGGVDK